MRSEPRAPDAVVDAMRDVFRSAGATPADAPLIQPLGLLLDLAGEAVRARLFVVQAEGGAEACLRPDFTVAVARQHLEAGGAQGRYVYEGPAFRAAADPERPEEFVQLGLEAFGDLAPVAEADAEIAQLAWEAARAGGRNDLTLWMGDVGLFAPFVDSLGLGGGQAARLKRVAGRPRLLWAELARTDDGERAVPSALAGLLAGLDEARAAALLGEVWALAGVEPVGGRGPAEIAARLVRRAEAADAPALDAGQAAAIRAFMGIADVPAAALAAIREIAGRRAPNLDAALHDWDARIERLTGRIDADRLRFAPALGHAFDYYDGLTLEVRSDALGPDSPVAVGGRYDGLLARLGGPRDGGRAVGAMVRPWRAWAGGES